MARSTLTKGSHEKRRMALTRALLGALHAAGLLLLPVVGRRAVSRAGHLSSESRAEQLRSRRRVVRVLAVVSGVAALSTFGTGVAFGFLSNSAKSGTNNFVAGKLSLGAPTTAASCAVTGALPGQSSSGPCTFHITYTTASNLSAYVAVDVLVVGGSATKGALWTGAATELQLTLATSPGAHPFTSPAKIANCTTAVGSQFGTSATGGKTCGEVNDDLLSTSVVTPGTAFTLHLSWALSATSPTGTQTDVAKVYVVFHAVESGNNILSCSATPTVGKSCTPSGSFKWS